jgi:cyclophilin family peptidyl-prolyl cis-trans isomerase
LIELDFVNAPITASNFKQYVEDGFFDGTVFHRVIKGFMIQGGGFTSEAVQKVTRNPIKLESDNGLNNNRGAIAMARTNVPDSATSQFFINTEKNSFLDYTSNNPGYAVFGKVIEGMDVVEIIEATETDANDWPLENIIIKRVYMKER